MASVYLDTSAIVRYLTAEPGHELVVQAWNQADAVITSILTDIEVRAVLQAGQRANLMTQQAMTQALQTWQRLHPSCYRVHLTEELQVAASELTMKYKLRAADAVQLASALTLHATTPSGEPSVLLLAWDESLRHAAQAEGLPLAPNRIGS